MSQGNGGSSGFHGEQSPVPSTLSPDIQSGSNQCPYNRYTCIWQGLVISSQKWNKFSLHDLFECLTPLLFRHNGYFQPWLFRIWTLSLINWRDIQSSFLSSIARVVLISVLPSVKRYQQTSTIDDASTQRSFSWTNFDSCKSHSEMAETRYGILMPFIFFCQIIKGFPLLFVVFWKKV